MKELKILCWNVNGIRAVRGKGFLGWLYRESPDIICLQETKAQPEQLDKELLQPHGYYAYWDYPEQSKGYSGVAIFTKEKPLVVQNGSQGDRLGAAEAEREYIGLFTRGKSLDGQVCSAWFHRHFPAFQ